MAIDKILNLAKQHLEDNEEVISAIEGSYETKILGKDSVRNGAFIATNKRLIFFSPKMFKNYEMEVFPYENISSIEMGKALMGHYISFFASGNKAKMKWIQSKNVQEFIDLLKSKLGKKESATPTSSGNMDIAEQIKKLAELKDAGILTDDEFQAKKTELLAKL